MRPQRRIGRRYRHTAGNPDAGANTHACSRACPYSDAEPHSNYHAHRDADSYAYRDANTDAHAYSYADGHACAHANRQARRHVCGSLRCRDAHE